MDIEQLKAIYRKHNFRFNPVQVHSFMKFCVPKLRPVIQKIIDNTLYVPFNDFIEQLNKLMDDYIRTYIVKHTTAKRPIFICRERDPSKQWLYTYVNNYFTEQLPKVKITYINSYPGKNSTEITTKYKLKQDDIIIFVDDCMYSGGHIGSLIDMFRSVKTFVNFYILVPYGTKYAMDYITYLYDADSRPSLHHSSSKRQKTTSTKGFLIFCETHSYKTISDVLSPDDIDSLSEYYPGNLLYTLGTSPLSLIYFDHKLADYGSVPAVIYLGVVPSDRNKQLFSTSSFRYHADFKRFSGNLTVVPLINNCEKYTGYLDLDEPACPHPPHKEGFDDFVSQLPSSVGGRKKTTTRRGRPRKT